MEMRRIGPFQVSAIGLGCMNLSHAYGTPPDEKEAAALLLEALDLGVNFFDTAALYGFGANETLVGKVLGPYRDRIILASKCGMTGVDGKRVIDGRPETLKRTCEESLRRLKTDVIDLYYLHRWDRQVPVEESVGALSGLVQEGKIRAVGLSEVSAETLRRAHAVHPVTAVQTEYSLWTRNPEIAVLKACEELGIGFVAFSPVARGFLAGGIPDRAALDALNENDIRRGMPRFYLENYSINLKFLAGFQQIAASAGCSPAQLALAWLLGQGEYIVPIPGTTQRAHLRDNLGALQVRLTPDVRQALEQLLGSRPIAGARYNALTQKEIDTEEFQ